MMNQELFDKINELFGVTPTQGEMDEILALVGVGKQRELLIDFCEFTYRNRNADLSDESIDAYLKINL